MTITEFQSIMKSGVEARVMGLSKIDSPYSSENMPTGEDLEEWQSKADAWRVGWILEDLVTD